MLNRKGMSYCGSKAAARDHCRHVAAKHRHDTSFMINDRRLNDGHLCVVLLGWDLSVRVGCGRLELYMVDTKLLVICLLCVQPRKRLAGCIVILATLNSSPCSQLVVDEDT